MGREHDGHGAPHGMGRRAFIGGTGLAVGAGAMLPVLGPVGAVGAAPAAAPGRGIPRELRPGGELDRFVGEEATQGRFAGSLLLTYRGREVLARSHGVADRERSVPNGPGTMFNLASVTKVITAVALAQLAQQGRLRYGDTLGRHLGGFPSGVGDTVTVHHLLTHTSGFADVHDLPGYAETAPTWSSPDEVMDGTVEFIRRYELDFPPGARHQYSNAGFHLVGAIVQELSGVSYYDYVREHVFGPLGLADTDFTTRDQRPEDPRIAHSYAPDGSGGWTDVSHDVLFIGSPAGGCFSTCSDMARFARALLDHELLDPGFTQITISGKVPPGHSAPPSGQRMRQEPSGPRPQAAFQAYGPTAGLFAGQWVVGHAGGSAGISTELQMYPDSDWVAVILSNHGSARPGTPPPVAERTRALIVEHTGPA